MDVDNINATLPVWAADALTSVDRWFGEFPFPLSARLNRIRERFSQGNGAGSVVGAMSAISATPMIALLEALRRDYEIEGDAPCMRDIGRATIIGHLYLRVQDDLVDEPTRFDSAFVYAMQVLHDTYQSAFAKALDGCPEFFCFQQSTMARFANAAVWEVDVFRAGVAEDADLAKIGEKFLPMALPLGALAFLANRPDDLSPLTRFVTELGTGLQFVNDVLNIREDHRSGRQTPVLRWLYENKRIGSGEAATDIRLLLITDSSLQRALQVARESISQAQRTARALGAHALAAVASNRIDFVESVPHRLLALQLGVVEL